MEDLALRALEAELHVLGGEGVAVVKPEALAQFELVDPRIRAHGPGLGQARAHEVAGHRLHERVVQGVEDPERSELAHHLARIEPDRRQRHVEGPAHLALRRGRRGRVAGEAAREQDAQRADDDGQQHSSSHAHARDSSTPPSEGAVTSAPFDDLESLPVAAPLQAHDLPEPGRLKVSGRDDDLLALQAVHQGASRLAGQLRVHVGA